MSDALDARDVEILMQLPQTLSGIPMRLPDVPAATKMLLARVELLRRAGLLTATREFPGQGLFNLSLMLTADGADAARRARRGR